MSVRASHILVKEKETCEALRVEILAAGPGGAPEAFGRLARERSTCPSGKNGGDLGSFGRGSMVPAFEAAAFSQAVGEVGPCVQTPFGHHLVLVKDRK